MKCEVMKEYKQKSRGWRLAPIALLLVVLMGCKANDSYNQSMECYPERLEKFYQQCLHARHSGQFCAQVEQARQNLQQLILQIMRHPLEFGDRIIQAQVKRFGIPEEQANSKVLTKQDKQRLEHNIQCYYAILSYLDAQRRRG